MRLGRGTGVLVCSVLPGKSCGCCCYSFELCSYKGGRIRSEEVARNARGIFFGGGDRSVVSVVFQYKWFVKTKKIVVS